MSDDYTPAAPASERFPYAAPAADAGGTGPSIQPVPVSRRADIVRREIAEVQQRVGQLESRERELLRQFPTGDEATKHAVFVRENGRELAAARAEVATLHTRLKLAIELDGQEGQAAGADDFGGHLALAMKHLQSRADFAHCLAQGFALIAEGLAGYQAANTAAIQHLHEAARHLPRKRRVDMTHAVRRFITGGHGIHALVQALRGAGVGNVGIQGGVILDVATGQVEAETFESALDKCNQRIAIRLAHWRTVAKGEQPKPLRIEPPAPPAAPAPRETKWADMTEIGMGGQRPGWTPPEQ